MTGQPGGQEGAWQGWGQIRCCGACCIGVVHPRGHDCDKHGLGHTDGVIAIVVGQLLGQLGGWQGCGHCCCCCSCNCWTGISIVPEDEERIFEKGQPIGQDGGVQIWGHSCWDIVLGEKLYLGLLAAHPCGQLGAWHGCGQDVGALFDVCGHQLGQLGGWHGCGQDGDVGITCIWDGQPIGHACEGQGDGQKEGWLTVVTWHPAGQDGGWQGLGHICWIRPIPVVIGHPIGHWLPWQGCGHCCGILALVRGQPGGHCGAWQGCGHITCCWSLGDILQPTGQFPGGHGEGHACCWAAGPCMFVFPELAIQPGGHGWKQGFGQPPSGSCCCAIPTVWVWTEVVSEQPVGQEGFLHGFGHCDGAVAVVEGQPDGHDGCWQGCGHICWFIVLGCICNCCIEIICGCCIGIIWVCAIVWDAIWGITGKFPWHADEQVFGLHGDAQPFCCWGCCCIIIGGIEGWHCNGQVGG